MSAFEHAFQALLKINHKSSVDLENFELWGAFLGKWSRAEVSSTGEARGPGCERDGQLLGSAYL